MSGRSLQPKLIVTAPQPSPASAMLPCNRIISVALAADERVEWTWSFVDGVNFVNGYTILKRTTREGEYLQASA